jgi:hypothetical protein
MNDLSTEIAEGFQSGDRDLGVWIRCNDQNYRLHSCSWMDYGGKLRGCMTFNEGEEHLKIIEEVKKLSSFEVAYVHIMNGMCCMKVIRNCKIFACRDSQYELEYTGNMISGWEMRSREDIFQTNRQELIQ